MEFYKQICDMANEITEDRLLEFVEKIKENVKIVRTMPCNCPTYQHYLNSTIYYIDALNILTGRALTLANFIPDVELRKKEVK